jgi:hypothetical protein
LQIGSIRPEAKSKEHITMKKTLRVLLRIVLGVISLGILAWLVLAGYVLVKEPELLRNAGAELNKRMEGTEFHGALEVSFFRHFPQITLHVSNVLLRDSLWQQHHHTLIDAKDVFVRFAPLSLFSGHLRVDKLFFESGSLYLFTDSTGYSDISVLRRLDWEGGGDGKKKEEGAGIPDLSLDRIRLIIERDDSLSRKELYDLDIHNFDCSIKKSARLLNFRVRTAIHVNNVAPDAEKGSFLKNKDLSGSFDLQYNTASKILDGKQVSLRMDDGAYLCTVRFFPDVSPDPFLLSVQAGSVSFLQAAGLFPLHVREQLFEYAIRNPVSLKLTLDAGAADKPYPQVTAGLTVEKKEDSLAGVTDKGTGEGLHIHYKGPLYESDSLSAGSRETLELDSAAWAPFKKALKK